jgi:hypothetical protein
MEPRFTQGILISLLVGTDLDKLMAPAMKIRPFPGIEIKDGSFDF